MRRTITIKQDDEVILRVTFSGNKWVVLKAIAEWSEKTFNYFRTAKEIKEKINSETE